MTNPEMGGAVIDAQPAPNKHRGRKIASLVGVFALSAGTTAAALRLKEPSAGVDMAAIARQSRAENRVNEAERRVRAEEARESREHQAAVVFLNKTIFFNQVAKNMLEEAERQKQIKLATANQPSSSSNGAYNGDFLSCTRAHESDTAGGYSAVSPDGQYRGAYQFDDSTWEGAVSRAGNPEYANTPVDQVPAEIQDKAALQLYSERGNQPWGGRC